MTTYPIIDEVSVPRQRRRFLGPVIELPVQSARSILVLTTPDGHEVVRGTPARGVLHDTICITTVDVSRDHVVTCQVLLPTENPADSFHVRVQFLCTVTDPAAVVRNGTLDVERQLSVYLSDRIGHLGQKYDGRDINLARAYITAQVKSAWEVDPRRIDGVAIALGAIHVLPPPPVVTHSGDIRALQAEQELKQLRAAGSHKLADAIERMMRRGPEAIDALAVEQGERTAAQVAQQMYANREAADRRMLALLKVLADSDQLDRAPIDVLPLLRYASERMTGQDLLSPTPAAPLEQGPEGIAVTEGELADEADDGEAAESDADLFALDEPEEDE